MSPAEITQQLGLQSLTRRAWVNESPIPEVFAVAKRPSANPSPFSSQYIQSTCATTGDGLYEGLEWLANALKKAGHE